MKKADYCKSRLRYLNLRKFLMPFNKGLAPLSEILLFLLSQIKRNIVYLKFSLRWHKLVKVLMPLDRALAPLSFILSDLKLCENVEIVITKNLS